MSVRTIVLDEKGLRVADVAEVARGEATLRLSREPGERERIEAGARALAARLAAGERVYGVPTGFGESCVQDVPDAFIEQLPVNLLRFHGCGTGEILDEERAAAVVAVRVASLSSGYSAIRHVVLERLVELLERRVLPRIPAEGSVGASGDLTPLSYVAAMVVGEREVWSRGGVRMCNEVLAELGLAPLALLPKESLAIMNGTSVMTALACIALERSRFLVRLVAALTAGVSEVLRGNPAHFDPRIHAAKPHPGQCTFARWVADDLELARAPAKHEGRIQDRYSIRCAPHVAGVLLDAIPWMDRWLDIEVNGANDNPLIDPATGEALHGGNFYGGHPCFVADALKTAVANLADLMDRQLALMCSRDTNAGLAENLVGRRGEDRAAHHGFKAMQIAASALTAEALKLTMPASVFSRSTECHNQDKVSMGTIAARDCLRVVELCETVAAIHLLAVAQAVDLREGLGCHARSRSLRDTIRELSAFVDADRPLDGDIASVLRAIRGRRLPVGELG